MKVILTNTNNNFKGYKNILSHTEGNPEAKSFSVIALELTNEGKKDLDKWYQIQKEYMDIANPSNYCVFYNYEDFERNIFGIGSNYINLEKKDIDKKYEHKCLDILEFLYFLTERISRDVNFNNSSLHITTSSLINTLKRIYPNDNNFSDHIHIKALKKTVKTNFTAKIINKNIDNLMIKYFKV